jgi:hypothetical protein
MTLRSWRWVPGLRWWAKRRQAKALAYAPRWQKEEREAARQRLLDAARTADETLMRCRQPRS